MELNTMPGWAGSSWYFNRYMDPHNDEAPFGKEAVNYWQKVDLYLGGSEHATGHLLYSRFWQKFLFDVGMVPEPEYSVKLINQGMILGTSAFVYRIKGTNKFVSFGLKDQYEVDALHADVNFVNDYDELDIKKFKAWRAEFADAEFVLEDGKYKVGREVEKMSKRWYNVVNPDVIVERYGADTLRMYEMFLGPIEIAKPWNTAGIKGVHNFLRKFWAMFHNDGIFDVSLEEPTEQELKILHKTIKKVTEDIENFSFNTAVSQFMIALNELGKLKTHKRKILSPLVVLLSPFAPHLAEDLWDELGHEGKSIAFESYPKHEERYLRESNKTYPIMVNGKMRHKIDFPTNMSKDEIERNVLADNKVKQILSENELIKVIVVPNKIVNLVVKK